MASRCVMFIFQLPAISVRRSPLWKAPRRGSGRSLRAMNLNLSAGQDGEAREFPALEVLQRRAAAGADVPVGGLVETQLPDGRGGVPAAHDRQAVHRGDRRRDPAAALLEGGELEDAHRPVTEDRARVPEIGTEQLDRAE